MPISVILATLRRSERFKKALSHQNEQFKEPAPKKGDGFGMLGKRTETKTMSLNGDYMTKTSA